MSLSFDAIVFDFDLTLADSRRGFIACHNFAAAQNGLAVPSTEAITESIGTPLDIVFERFYGKGALALSESYLRAYQRHADEVMTDLTVMLDGAAAAVETMRRAGLKLAILSQKLRYRVEEVLRREGLLDCFAVVLGGDDTAAFKPDPRGLLEAIRQLDSAGKAVFVGDTTIDAQTAANAGVPFIAVLTGAMPPDAFSSYEPVAILDSVRMLPAFLGIEPAP